MKILITTDCYTPMVNGVVTSILTLEQELWHMGHEVKILCPSQNLHCNDNGKVYMIGSVGAGKIYAGARAAFRGSNRNLTDLIAWKPDIIHSQSEFASFLMAKRIAKAVGCPIVHTYHTVYENYTHYFSPSMVLGRKAAILFSKKVLSRVQSVIAPSAKIEHMLHEYGVEKPICVIPTGLDVHRFVEKKSKKDIAARKKTLGIPDSDKVLLTVGRAAKEKNIEELLQFLKRLCLDHITFLVVGGGPFLESLKQLAQELGIAEKVVFTGMVEPAAVPLYYQLGDIFLSASNSETQGLTYLEALASGVPAVCRDDACLNGVICNGVNGFRYADYSVFSSAVKALLTNRQLYADISQNASASVQAYASAAFAQKVIAFYQDTIKAFYLERSENYEAENALSDFKNCG